MRKKILPTTILLISSFLMLFVSGCGSSGTNEEKQEVKFFNGKIESVDYMSDLIKKFNKENTKYKVVQEFQKDASQAMQTKLASGDVPDLTSTEVTQTYIDAGKFQDLSKEKIWQGIDPTIKQLVTDVKSGKQYKIAISESMAGIFYNKKLVPKGIAFDSWTHFSDDLENIKKNYPTKAVLFLGGKDSWTLDQLMQFWGQGIIKSKYSPTEATKLFINNNQKKLNFSSENGPIYIFARKMNELKSKGLLNKNVITASYDDQVQEFASGRAVAIPQGLWAMSAILQKNKDMDIGFIPFPPMNQSGKPIMLVGEDSTFAIPTQAKNKKGALAFLKFLLKRENLEFYSEKMKVPSSFTNIKANWSEDRKDFEKAKQESTPIGFTSFPSGFSGDDSGRYVQSFFSGQYKTPEQFTKAYSEAWNKAWEAQK
ncbi:MAG: extracellular solute-binding protein [Sporolactobacillus sp.]|jgi:raffinose/stachyose/melibiose transport system substrate-binding protein|nr:extracellular solute-binding protein [Sporolactobacillus sp.]